MTCPSEMLERALRCGQGEGTLDNLAPRRLDDHQRPLHGAEPALLLRVDSEQNVVGLDGTGLDQVGFNRDAASVQDILTEADPPEVLRAACARALVGERTQLRIRWRGQDFFGQVLPVLGQDGRVGFADGLFFTAPKGRPDGEASALTQLLNHVAGMVYRCQNDEAWTMDLVSDGCLALTGYTVEELHNNSKVAFGDLVHPDDVDWLWEKCQANLEAKRFCSNQYRIIDAAGQTRWVWDRAQGVYDKAGELLYIEGLITDITEEKRAEEVRKTLEEQLRQSQKMEVVGQLAGGISHDFNNLLSVISVNASMMLLELDAQSPMRAFVEQVQGAVERSSTLINQLLAFSRKQVTQPRVFAPAGAVDRLQLMLSRGLGEKIVLRTSAQPATGNVRMDPVQFEQIVLNLAINARDAMPEGGELRIELSCSEVQEPRPLQVASLAKGAYVALSLHDDGCGMDADTLERAFEPFFTTKPGGTSTGLGLATIKAIVEQHGGGIEVRSRPDAGTSFTVYLPRVALRSEQPEPSSARQPLGGDETLLLVEDEALVLLAATTNLERLGYRVLSASSGVDALAVAQRFDGPIDLLITDVVMPRMNGLELANRLRKSRPTLRVLFMSGYSKGEIAEYDVINEDVQLLAKPYTLETLATRVREALVPVRSHASW